MNSRKISIHIGADANLSGVDRAKRSLADLSAAAGKLGSVFGGASSLIGSFFGNILKGSVWQTGASAIGFVYKKVVEHVNAAKEAEKQAAKAAKEAADERLKSIADYSAAVDRLAQTRKNTVNQNLKNLNDEIDATKDLTRATLELQRAEARKRGDSAAARAIEGEMDALDFSAAREKLTNEIAAVGKRRDAERAEVAGREKGLADLTAVIGELTKRQSDLVRSARERATRNAMEVAGGSPSIVGGLTYVPASEKAKRRLGDAAEAELRKTDEFRAVAAQIEDARKRADDFRDPTAAAAAVADGKSRAEDLDRFHRDASRYGGKWRIDELSRLMAAGDVRGQADALASWRKSSRFTPEVEAMVMASTAERTKTTAEDELRKIESNTADLAAKLDELISMKGG